LAARGAGPTSTGWISTGRFSASAFCQLADIDVLDVRRDDHAAGAESFGALKLSRRRLRIGQRHRADPGEALGVIGAPFGQRIVEQPMPLHAGIAAKAVAEDIRPGADDLQIDALLVEPDVPLRDRLDEARKERPDLEAIGELQRRRGVARFHQRNADVLAAGRDRVERLRRNVVGVDVDRHGTPLAYRRPGRPAGIVCTQTIACVLQFYAGRRIPGAGSKSLER
jgi:hypothetical protein